MNATSFFFVLIFNCIVSIICKYYKGNVDIVKKINEKTFSSDIVLFVTPNRLGVSCLWDNLFLNILLHVGF